MGDVRWPLSGAHVEETELTTTKTTHGDITLLAAAVEKNPLSPNIEAYLESLGLDEAEKADARESMERLAGHFDTPTALPTVPPSIIRMGEWR